MQSDCGRCDIRALRQARAALGWPSGAAGLLHGRAHAWGRRGSFVLRRNGQWANSMAKKRAGILAPTGFPAALVLVWLCAFIPRYWLVVSSSVAEIAGSTDADGYVALATNLLQGHGFSLYHDAPYHPDSIRTPLYPLFVAAIYGVVGPSPHAVALVQAALDAGTAVLVAVTMARLAGREPGIAAGALYALTPSQWRYSAVLLTEIPLAFLLAASMAYMVLTRGPLRVGAGMGALAGLAVLCKPNALALPLIWAGVAAMRARPAWKTILFSCATSAIVLAPWVARNWHVFGRPMVSTAFENNLVLVSAVATLIDARGEAYSVWDPRGEDLFLGVLSETEQRYGFRFANERSWSPPEADLHQRQAAAVAWEIVRTHPLSALRSHLAGIAGVWKPIEYLSWYEFFTGSAWPRDHLAAAKDALMEDIPDGHLPSAGEKLRAAMTWETCLALSFWLTWWAVCLAGAICLVAGVYALREHRAFLFGVLVVMVYLTILPGPIASERFRVPFAPFLAMLEGAGAVRIVQLLITARRNELTD
jgi:4-amino-4-deoxy-L-arabinose transferase-like glycosyltransferase